MAQRNSLQDSDGTVWEAAGVRLGIKGLDLREPSEPGSLTKLINARFADDRTIEPRRGHSGVQIGDGADYPALGSSYEVSGDWVYGHGATVSSTNAAGWENAHHPIPGAARGTFRFEGADIVWTGDRLLVSRAEAAALGASPLWAREEDGDSLNYGIPAFLPLQVDSNPPGSFATEYANTCLTSRYRVLVHNANGGQVVVWIIDRETGAVINQAEISGASNDPVEPCVVNSNEIPVVIWRDYTSRVLYMRYWTGSAWSGEDALLTNVAAFDVCQVPGGFYLLWRTEAPGAVELRVGVYAGVTEQSTPFSFGTVISDQLVSDVAPPDGPVAIDVAPSGQFAVLAEASGLQWNWFTPQATSLTDWTEIGATPTDGITIRSRGLKNSVGRYDWVVHAGIGGVVYVAEVTVNAANNGTVVAGSRQNSKLASRSFRAGDEVFCWLYSTNAKSLYLVTGGPQCEVVGYADREEAVERSSHDENLAIPYVLPDPLDERGLNFTWIRPFNTGQDYRHGGNVRIGDIDMMPKLTTAQYGESIYLSGSAVRNWDGVKLGDAGFQDYPVISAVVKSNGAGALTATGKYYYRVYAVRYNARGERFQSAAVSYGPVDLVGVEDTVVLTIKTLPSTNHDDVVLEVYRTESLGTTFYFEGYVNNSLTAATVAFSSEMADATLRTKLGDSKAAGVGALSEVEEWGPLGCSILAVSGDRLWGAGGQVPAGTAQFSKLREEGEGVGFDILSGYQVIDPEGAPITSIHWLNDTTVAHQEKQVHVLAGAGPNNYGQGNFGLQLSLADGAINHQGTKVTPLGAAFWGKDGPRLLTTSFQVLNISPEIRPLAETMTPSGVQADDANQEVIWYTEDGTALLWNSLGGNSRWAQWTGLKIAGCSDSALVTTTGWLLYDDAAAAGDAGQGIEFVWCTGNLRAEQIIMGASLLKRVGVVGKYQGPHKLRMRIYYDGSPMWTEEWKWEPAANTWLTSGDDYADLTPAEIDALQPTDKSGAYGTHKRVSKINCRFFRVEVSNLGADGPTYTPYELACELGTKGGLARVPVNTFTTAVGR